jgi:hypothetical protein
MADLLSLHEDGWLPQLGLLGWTALEVFGCHPCAPLVRHDAAGLLVALEGRRVLAVTAEAVALGSPSGAALQHRNWPMTPQAVPIWQLPPLLGA